MAPSRSTLAEVFEVARSPDLSPGAKSLWMLYRSYHEKGSPDGWAWPSDETLAGHLDKGVRTVQAYRRELLESGYLEQQKRGPEVARYRAVLPSEVPQNLAEQDSQDPAKQGADVSQVVSQVVSQNSANRVHRENVLSTCSVDKSTELALDREHSETGSLGRQFAPLIRSRLWQGDRPPPKSPDRWTMGRELSIVRGWIDQGYRADDLAGGLELYRGPPIALAALVRDRSTLSELIGLHHKRIPSAGDVLERMGGLA